jgi:hypothetical protein
VPGLISEALSGKSFGTMTAKAIKGKFIKGMDIPNKKKFRSHFQMTFNPNNFRRFSKYSPNNRIVHSPDLNVNKDYEDYAYFINENMNDFLR